VPGDCHCRTEPAGGTDSEPAGGPVSGRALQPGGLRPWLFKLSPSRPGLAQAPAGGAAALAVRPEPGPESPYEYGDSHRHHHDGWPGPGLARAFGLLCLPGALLVAYGPGAAVAARVRTYTCGVGVGGHMQTHARCGAYTRANTRGNTVTRANTRAASFSRAGSLPTQTYARMQLHMPTYYGARALV
jgi:hypothetical protein